MTDQDTFSVTLAGRDVLFRYPLPGQLIMLRRRTIRLQQQSSEAKDDIERARVESRLVVDTLDLVESLIVDPENVEFLEQSMLLGTVGHEEVMDVLATKREEQKPARKKAAKAVTSRGRTRS